MLHPWLSLLTSFHRTPIFGRIALLVAAMSVYAAAPLALELALGKDVLDLKANVHTLLGLVLGVLLVFRTNTSYDRWWEGRKLWGQLVNESRNLALKIQACVQAPSGEKRELGRWLCDFAVALKDHLRDAAHLSRLQGFAADSAAPQHVPAYVVERIYERIEQWRQREQLGGFELLFLDRHAAALLEICGACERIRKSPIPLSYRWFIRQSVAIYLLTLPWGLAFDFSWWTVPAVGLITYFMAGLEIIAEEIEDPFGLSEDDLRLDELCQTIERSVGELVTG